MRRSPRSPTDATRHGRRLARGNATVSELAAPFAISLGISKHLKVLEHSGLIFRGGVTRSSASAIWRRTRSMPRSTGSRHTGAWDERFDKLDTHLRTVLEHEQTGRGGGTGRSARRSPDSTPGTDPSTDRSAEQEVTRKTTTASEESEHRDRRQGPDPDY